MSTSENADKTEANVGTPVGGKVPLASPDPEHQGHGWVQVGVTNTNKDPDAVLNGTSDSTK